MDQVDTFQRGSGLVVGIDTDEQFNAAPRPARQRSQAELDFISQEIGHALKLERALAEQASTPVELPAMTEVDISIIEQPSST